MLFNQICNSCALEGFGFKVSKAFPEMPDFRKSPRRPFLHFFVLAAFNGLGVAFSVSEEFCLPLRAVLACLFASYTIHFESRNLSENDAFLLLIIFFLSTYFYTCIHNHMQLLWHLIWKAKARKQIEKIDDVARSYLIECACLQGCQSRLEFSYKLNWCDIIQLINSRLPIFPTGP